MLFEDGESVRITEWFEGVHDVGFGIRDARLAKLAAWAKTPTIEGRCRLRTRHLRHLQPCSLNSSIRLPQVPVSYHHN